MLGWKYFKSLVARAIPFDNSTNGWIATETQSAIEEAKSQSIATVGGAITFGFDGNASSGRWLETFTNIASNLTGYVIAGNKTLRGLSIAGATGSTYTATVTLYKNGVLFETISLTASRKNTKLNLIHNFIDKDEITAQLTSGSITRPIVTAW
jgi:hypothetical protein